MKLHELEHIVRAAAERNLPIVYRRAQEIIKGLEGDGAPGSPGTKGDID